MVYIVVRAYTQKQPNQHTLIFKFIINTYSRSARGHSIDFSGASWIKIEIVNGDGSLDEVEVFDISNGAQDTWFFPGTSISAIVFKGTSPSRNDTNCQTTACL